MRNISFAVAGAIGLALAALAPVPSQAAASSGAYAPTVETPLEQARYTCVRKSGGQVACGYWTRWGFRQTGPSNYGYGGGYGYYGYYRPRYYGYYGYYRPRYYGYW
jgi:hypothetical protein